MVTFSTGALLPTAFWLSKLFVDYYALFDINTAHLRMWIALILSAGTTYSDNNAAYHILGEWF